MLKPVFKKLDQAITECNREASKEGFLPVQAATIRVLGQTALFEAQVDLRLNATQDVDAYVEGEYWVKKKFDELLHTIHKHLDPLSQEVWMPTETRYLKVFEGRFLKAFVAEPDYVLFSKAFKSPEKNKRLLAEYLQKGPSEAFMKLVDKYKLNLENVLR